MERLRLVAVSCVLVFLLASPCTAQTTPAGPNAAKQITIIRAAHLLDVRDGHALADQAILVEGDRIRQIGAAASLIADLGRGAKVIDLGNTTLLPGLIDCHNHILGNPKDQSPTASLRMSSPQQTLWGLHNLQIWLAHGFTALRDAGESDLAYGQLALRNSINQGLVQGPRIV